MNESENTEARPLPWFVDVFLYPTSFSGLINLGIFWILPIIFGVVRSIIRVPFVFGFFGLAVLSYMFYYYTECIRASATGATRAPENSYSMPDITEAGHQLLEIITSVVICWGPLIGYMLYRYSYAINDNYVRYEDKIYWLLVGYGVFLFPMVLLSIIMFNSSAGFNPFIWIASMFSTFFQYCGLVVLLLVLSFLFQAVANYMSQYKLLSFLAGGVLVYFAMIFSHLLGRFYHVNQKELNWEV